MAHDLNAVFYSHTYHPIQAGSIDGTDTTPHDNAVCRAMLSTGLYDPTGDAKAHGNPYCIVFVGRLSRDTTEETLHEEMSKYGKIKNLRLVRHIVTGASQGYAFVEYETEKEMRYAYEAAHLIKIDGNQVLVDYNRQLLMPGWIPRRLGGGLGGRKESGQLRFGGRDRPFRKPLRPIPTEELEKLGIPLPGGYMQRFETPPLPKRRPSRSGTKASQNENVHRSPEKDSRRVSSQEARCREEDDRIWHGQREEKRLAHFEEEDAKQYSKSLDKRDSLKKERHRDDTLHRDYDGQAQRHERKADHETESRKPLKEEESENSGRRMHHWDDNERHAKKLRQGEDDNYKRQYDDRREKTHARGEEDRRWLDERHQSRSSKQHYLEHYDGRDRYREDSGRSHHRDKHGKKKANVSRWHFENEEDGDEDSEVKDGHSTRRRKRKHHSGAERTSSADSLSSESEARSRARKVHRRDDNERLQSREGPHVENRWKPG